MTSLSKKILVSLIIVNTNAFCQNIIKNGDFENVRTGSEFPIEQAQADNLENWETRTSEKKGPFEIQLHSPDWIYSNSGENGVVGGSFPKSGEGLIGMFNYELIQQQIDGSLLHYGKSYRLSFFIKRANHPVVDFENSVLKFYLLKDKYKYENEPIQEADDLCTNEYISQSGFNNLITEPMEIYEYEVTNLLSTKEWVKVSIIYDLPMLNCNTVAQDYCGYNWFMIQLENINAPQVDINSTSNQPDCEDGYIYLDKISFVEATGCEIDCRTILGEIEITPVNNVISSELSTYEYQDPVNGFLNNIFPNWNDEDAYQDAAFGIKLKGAIGYTFEVFTSESESVFFKSEFDVNGLKDPTFDDYLVTWKGNNTSLTLQTWDQYPYILNAWNCEDEIRYDGAIIFLNTPENLQDKPEIGFNFDHDCCPDNLLIQNKTYYESEIIKAAVSIRAGSNVNPNLPAGNVVFSLLNNENVEYIAPIISLESGFITSTEFTATIGECTIYQERISSISFNRDQYLRNVKANDISFVPINPMKVSEYYRLPDSIDASEIYTVDGRLISSNIGNDLHLPIISTGLYLFRFHNKIQNSWIHRKIVVAN